MNTPAARCATNVVRDKTRQWFCDYLPVTGGNKVELLVDGENYGKSLYAELASARSEVLLTGLHFHPEYGLVRGGNTKTLLSVLQTLAQGGVNIYLIVNQFWPNESTTGNIVKKAIINAGHLDWYMPATVKLFDGLRKYPNAHLRTDVHHGFVMSTHHQKTVIIDQRVAFVGGIDLTRVDGDRWDTNSHSIPGSHTADVRKYDLPEHFWHDVHCKITGPAVKFVLDNFHARWNHGDLYKDVVAGTRTKYIPVGEGFVVEVPENYIEGTRETSGRHIFTRQTLEESQYQIYQELTRDRDGVHSRWRPVRRGVGETYMSACGQDAVATMTDAKVQVVRSMPAGQFEYGKQKPKWNLSEENWERSAKDAYLIGIRAAKDYIYLENQWISDEDIWDELKKAMKRNRNNPDFRIVIVLPRRPLDAAGYGSDQDVDLSGHVKDVMKECADAAQFGMYCLEQKIPGNRHSGKGFDKDPDDVQLSPEDIKEFGSTTAQIYIHSKVQIIDDQWALIGSANAGGISLLGMTNLGKAFTSGRGSTPDSELSVIIHDPAFGKNFRETVWKEHLEGSLPGSVAAAADAFRQKANTPGSRIRPAVVFHAALGKGGDAIRRVSPHVMARVKANARIVPSQPGPVSLRAEKLVSFNVETIDPGAAYSLLYRWSLEDERGGRWLLRAVGSNQIVQNYGPEGAAYIPPKTAEALRAQRGMNGVAKMMCRMLVIPKGVAPRKSGDDDDQYSVLMTLPITLNRT